MGYRRLIQKEAKMEIREEKKNAITPLPKLKNVAAYARVSSAKDAMHRSLAAQISCYSRLIQSRPGWRYVGVFADEGLTGTKEEREGFQKLLAKCRAGEIDMVITKSVSRFARNTVTLLKIVRELKGLGIDVYFEEQNIHSLSKDGELMLTILASFAQAESESVSKNMKWRIKKCFEEGRPWNVIVYGYRWNGEKFEIEPAEAAVVRRIYDEYLSGMGLTAIANGLNVDKTPPVRAGKWNRTTIAHILRNRTYAGDLLLQKTYREDPLTKRKMLNDGVLPQYLAEGAHDAIIDSYTFDMVQAEIERRAGAYKHDKRSTAGYPFTGKVFCSHCGRPYRRKTKSTGFSWICPTYNSEGKAACPSKAVPEDALYELTGDLDLAKVKRMTAEDGNIIRIVFTDGREIARCWEDHSRSNSWTDEMKLKAKAAAEKRWKKNGKR